MMRVPWKVVGAIAALVACGLASFVVGYGLKGSKVVNPDKGSKKQVVILYVNLEGLVVDYVDVAGAERGGTYFAKRITHWDGFDEVSGEAVVGTIEYPVSAGVGFDSGKDPDHVWVFADYDLGMDGSAGESAEMWFTKGSSKVLLLPDKENPKYAIVFLVVGSGCEQLSDFR